MDYTSSQQHASMVMQPILVQPMMIYCTPTYATSETWGLDARASQEKKTTREVPEETGEKAYNESDEDIYYHIAEAYNHAGQWRAVEEKLFIRATKLPSLESCYIEGDNGGYEPWGSKAEDCEGDVLDKFSHGLVHLNLTHMEAHTITKGKSPVSLCGLKVALREIRTYPNLIGIACFEDGRKCFLEASWNQVTKKESKHHLANELLLAIIRCKKPGVQITFW